MFKNSIQFIVVRYSLILAFIMGMLGAQPVAHVHAATFIVTNTNDSGPGSLRQAIDDASSSDTITFDSSLSGQTVILESSFPMIVKNLTIDGSALASKVTISGNHSAQVFTLDHSSVTLKSLIIVNGNAVDDRGGGVGVYNGT